MSVTNLSSQLFRRWLSTLHWRYWKWSNNWNAHSRIPNIQVVRKSEGTAYSLLALTLLTNFKLYGIGQVIRGKFNLKSKGYGFVSLLDPFEAAKAIREKNGKYLGNRCWCTGAPHPSSMVTMTEKVDMLDSAYRSLLRTHAKYCKSCTTAPSLMTYIDPSMFVSPACYLVLISGTPWDRC